MTSGAYAGIAQTVRHVDNEIARAGPAQTEGIVQDEATPQAHTWTRRPPVRARTTTAAEPTEQEDPMYATLEEDRTRPPHAPAPDPAPPLRLAGIDEDDTWEPHVVRGID